MTVMASRHAASKAAQVGLAVVQTLFADDVHGNPQPPRGVDRMLPSAFTKSFHESFVL
jgi:hypothetical protein